MGIQETQESLHRAFEMLNNDFTSSEFAFYARQNGISDQLISTGALAIFLHKRAKQTFSKRTWQKKDNKPTTAKNIDFDVEKAIKLLKNNGFKIMKNISEWKEM